MFALAWRNLWRYPRRTVLNLVAMVFATVVTVFMLSLQVGTYDSLIDHALKVFHGYAQVRPAGEKNLNVPRRIIRRVATVTARVKQYPGVTHASPRAMGYALLSSAERSYAVQIIGISPGGESQISSLPKAIRRGRFVLAGDVGEIVIGAILARNLRVDIGDTVTLLGIARDGSVAADVLRVVGVFETGTRELDRGLAQMPLARFQAVYGMPGAAHTIVITTDSLAILEETLRGLRAQLAGQNFEVLGWERLAPGLMQAIELDAGTAMILYVGLLVVVIFSLLNSLIAQHRLRGAALSAQLLSSASLHSTGLKAAALRALAINPLERKYALSFECYAFSAQNEFRSTAEPLISVLERTREFGVLLAIGMPPAMLARVVWLETVLLAGLGVGSGLLTGWAITACYAHFGLHLEGLDTVVAQWGLPDRLYPEITAFTLLTGPLVLLVSVLLAGALAVLRIWRLQPITAMRSI